jgi:hypothetical protein
MKVDTSFLQVPLAAAPQKPQPRQTEQASARPVDRPHHDEAANNQQTRETDSRAEPHRETAQLGPATLTLGAQAKPDQHSKSNSAEGAEHRHRSDNNSQPQRGGFSASPTQPASVGKLLDVIA